MRWAIQMSREAMEALYHHVERQQVRLVTAALQSLAENPLPSHTQTAEEDPSLYWIGVEGDYVIFYEILDERHTVFIVDIE